MQISFDLDGVLANFEENAARVINARYPGKIPDGYRPTNWNWTDVMTIEDWNQLWKDVETVDSFWLRQWSYPAAVVTLQDFLDDYPEIRVHFLTARKHPSIGCDIHSQTFTWLWRHGLGQLQHNIALNVVENPEQKIPYISEEGINFHIDDKPETVAACNDIAGHRAYLLNQPWNQNSTEPRVYSVAEFLDIVEEAHRCALTLKD